MAQTSKYYKQQRYVSYDSGNTWTALNEFRKGAWIEDNSIDCGGSQTTYEKWEVVDGYICSNGNKFEKERKYTSHDNINWTPTEEYREGDLLQADSSDCGYMEKWETVSIDDDWICDGDSNKYYKEIMYVSRNSGSTWVETSTYRKGELYESGSTNCFKLHLEYSDGDELILPCDDATSITSSDTKTYGDTPENPNGGYEKYTKLTDATIGACVQTIGYDSFNGYYQGCGCVNYNTQLTSVTIYEGVKTIGQSAFQGQSKVTHIQLPNTLTRIQMWAFSSMGLTALTIPSSVTYINQQAFLNNEDLETVVWNANYSVVQPSLFNGCHSLSSITFNYNIIEIGQNAFVACYSLKNLNFLPSSVSIIGQYAFSYCSGLTEATIPTNVTIIRPQTFRDCTSLSSLTLNNNITEIGSYAFFNCYVLDNVTLPNALTTIGNDTFRNCSGMTSIEIPSTVTSIGSSAFSNCKSLTSITVNATTPPTLGSSAFNNTNSCPIYVPSDKVSTYKRASGWSTYASRIQAIS